MKKMKITALKACQMRDTGQTLVKVETDAGITGYGEAGGPGPMTRGFLTYYEEALLGKDPLEIDKLYQVLMNYQHPNRGHIPTTSGIDIALWDIAGKAYGKPISKIYRGQFREWIQMYVNTGGPANWLDKAACRAWAAEVKASPYGYKAVKICKNPVYDNILKKPFSFAEKRFPMIPPADMRVVIQGYVNLREALDPSIDIIVHCHNEFDLPSMIQFARDLEVIKPLWLEDPLPVLYIESWKSLKQVSRVPLNTGEKLEGPWEFFAFMQNQAIDMLQPDLVFAGGYSGCWRIADMAEHFAVPITMHNVGAVLQNAMTAQFAAATRNFVMTETNFGNWNVHEEFIKEKLEIKDGFLKVPDGPGIGVTPIEAAIKEGRMPGEPYWD
jgi:L-alanine-DL-glutamate epimerase-like enolase superfamily enzyme